MNSFALDILGTVEKLNADVIARPGEAREIVAAARQKVIEKMQKTDELEGGQYKRPLRELCGAALSIVNIRERATGESGEVNRLLRALESQAEKL